MLLAVANRSNKMIPLIIINANPLEPPGTSGPCLLSLDKKGYLLYSLVENESQSHTEQPNTRPSNDQPATPSFRIAGW
jgi:hypothetical protein